MFENLMNKDLTFENALGWILNQIHFNVFQRCAGTTKADAIQMMTVVSPADPNKYTT